MIVTARYDSDTSDTSKEPYLTLLGGIDAIAGYEKHTLKPSAGGHDCFGYSIGDEGKPCILVDGVIHNNHEWKSAYSTKELMRVIANPALYPTEQDLIEYLKNKYRFYFIPVVSPDSYVNGSGPNENGVRINNNFDYFWESQAALEKGPYPFSETEAQNIRDVVLSENTAMYINLHTVGNSNDLLMIRENRNADIAGIPFALAENADLLYADYGKPSRVSGPLVGSASSYNWAGEQEGALSEKVLATVYEPGFGLTIPQNASISVWGMIFFIANADDYLVNPPEDDELLQLRKNRFFFDLNYLT